MPNPDPDFAIPIQGTILNWQTQNANAQNQALHHLDKKINKVASQVSQTETKVDTINAWLEHIYSNLQNKIS